MWVLATNADWSVIENGGAEVAETKLSARRQPNCMLRCCCCLWSHYLVRAVLLRLSGRVIGLKSHGRFECHVGKLTCLHLLCVPLFVHQSVVSPDWRYRFFT